MALTAYTYNSLNGYCGNCSIVLSKQDSHHDGKQKSNYSIINSSVSKLINSVFASISEKRIIIQR